MHELHGFFCSLADATDSVSEHSCKLVKEWLGTLFVKQRFLAVARNPSCLLVCCSCVCAWESNPKLNLRQSVQDNLLRLYPDVNAEVRAFDEAFGKVLDICIEHTLKKDLQSFSDSCMQAATAVPSFAAKTASMDQSYEQCMLASAALGNAKDCADLRNAIGVFYNIYIGQVAIRSKCLKTVCKSVSEVRAILYSINDPKLTRTMLVDTLRMKIFGAKATEPTPEVVLRMVDEFLAAGDQEMSSAEADANAMIAQAVQRCNTAATVQEYNDADRNAFLTGLDGKELSTRMKDVQRDAELWGSTPEKIMMQWGEAEKTLHAGFTIIGTATIIQILRSKAEPDKKKRTMETALRVIEQRGVLLPEPFPAAAAAVLL